MQVILIIVGTLRLILKLWAKGVFNLSPEFCKMLRMLSYKLVPGNYFSHLIHANIIL